MSERHTLTGNIQSHPAFSSRLLKNERGVMVYLPPGYRRGKQRRYPVLYLQDGQNVFDAATAFGGVEWGADETAQQLIRKGLVEPLIIVAVENIGEGRIDEYAPTPSRRVKNRQQKSRGQLRKYGRFLVEELKPFIDRTYRTRPEKESTGIGGSSLGGLAALVLGFWYPETFTRIAALSPSIWWDDYVIYRLANELGEATPRSSRIWLDTGTQEEGWERLAQFRDHLVSLGWRLYGDFQYLEIADGEHTEAAWARRFEAVLRFLYPPLPPGLRNPLPPPVVAMRRADSWQPTLERLAA